MLKAKIAIDFDWSERINAYESEGNCKRVSFITNLPCKPNEGDNIQFASMHLKEVAYVSINDNLVNDEFDIFVRMKDENYNGSKKCADELREFYDNVEVKLI